MDALMGATTTVAEIDGLRAEIAELRTRYESVRTALVAEQSKARQAVEAISDRMIAEAEEHGFCDLYDTAVREINKGLPDGFPKIRERSRTWTVTGTWTVTIVREIEATSEADALDEYETTIEGELDSMKYEDEIDEYSLDESNAEVES